MKIKMRHMLTRTHAYHTHLHEEEGKKMKYLTVSLQHRRTVAKYNPNLVESEKNENTSICAAVDGALKWEQEKMYREKTTKKIWIMLTIS